MNLKKIFDGEPIFDMAHTHRKRLGGRRFHNENEENKFIADELNNRFFEHILSRENLCCDL